MTPTQAPPSGTLEIRPGPFRQLAVVAGCLIFVGLGVLLVLAGPIFQKVIGVAAAAFFGWGLVVALRRFRERRAIVVSPAGLRPAAGGEIPWDDIEEVGTFKYRHNTLVGLRLSRRERFVASFTEAERRRLARTNTVVRALGGIFRPDIAGRLEPVVGRGHDGLRAPPLRLRLDVRHARARPLAARLRGAPAGARG